MGRGQAGSGDFRQLPGKCCPALASALAAEPFDYLFSVVNMRMLSPSVLSLPGRLAVNFHDALQTAPLSGAAYHLTNPHRMSLATLTGFLRSAGYELTDYPLTRWAALIRDQPGNAALSVLDIFLREMTAGGWSDLVLSNASTRRALGDNDPGCPELTAGLSARSLISDLVCLVATGPAARRSGS